MSINEKLIGKTIQCLVADIQEIKQEGKKTYNVITLEIQDQSMPDEAGMLIKISSFQLWEKGKGYPVTFALGGKNKDVLTGLKPKTTEEEREERRAKQAQEQREYEATVGSGNTGMPSNAADATPAANLIPQPSERDILLAADYGYTPKQVTLMESNNIIPKGTPHAQIAHFFEVAKARGLSPITKQIYLLPFAAKDGDRWVTNYAVIVSIDGMRSMADKTKQLAGIDEPLFDGMTLGQWFAAGNKFPTYKAVGTGKDARYHLESGNEPNVCTVIVKRKQGSDISSYTGVATWGEYYPGPVGKGGQWRKMPFVMLAKCAKAQALRDAFPAAISGLNIPEEFDQRQREVVDVAHEPIDMREVLAQLKNLHTIQELQAFRNAHPEYVNNEEINEAMAERHREITTQD